MWLFKFPARENAFPTNYILKAFLLCVCANVTLKNSTLQKHFSAYATFERLFPSVNMYVDV